MAIETELKLALPAGAASRLKERAGEMSGSNHRQDLYSLYFDTPGFELYRRGIALRLRRVGYHWVQTLKAEAAGAGLMAQRPEWEIQVTGNTVDLGVLPEEARALLAGISADRLAPAFLSEFKRTVWMVDSEDGRVELALDQGHLVAGEQRQPLSEIELELKAGAPAALFTLARQLAAAVPMHVEPRSKAMRGYALAGAFEPTPCKAVAVDIHPGMAAGEAWQRMLEAALGQFTANLPGYLESEDPEYLHQMRVAIRRLRTVLAEAPRIGLAMPAWAAAADALMDILSPARDWDVFCELTLPAVQEGLAAPDALAGLARAAARQRAGARRRVRAALLAPDTLAWLLAASEDLVSPPATAVTVDAWASHALDCRFKTLRQRGKGFARLDGGGRHRLRIAVKKMRYTLEAFAPLHGRRARDLLADLARMQDVLGAANDIVVAHRLLDTPAMSRPHARAVGLVEGWLACLASQAPDPLRDLIRGLRATRPFWRRSG